MALSVTDTQKQFAAGSGKGTC
uniref:Uncharacterized protein n=1 Tax=Anguilla anguilla TaxID=7936 RepID=A0A0E9SCT9_ANGAN